VPADLTERQQQLLERIRAEWPLTVRGAMAGIYSSTGGAYPALRKLRSLGLVTWEAGAQRTIRPTDVEPKAVCSHCGRRGRVEAGTWGCRCVCEEHGVYFEFYVPRPQRRALAAA
jgi:hypothetical protein